MSLWTERSTIDRLSCTGDRMNYREASPARATIQFLTDPHGEPIWSSPALPGSVHDMTTAREHGIVDSLTARAVACHADRGCVGAGAIGTPT
jgi:hypothetical protein